MNRNNAIKNVTLSPHPVKNIWDENDHEHNQQILAILERACASNLKLKGDTCEIRASVFDKHPTSVNNEGILQKHV